MSHWVCRNTRSERDGSVTITAVKEHLELRMWTGLSQRDFAKILGVTQPAVAAYESGKRTPIARVAARYAEIDAATTAPSRHYGEFRGRPIEFPAEPWKPIVQKSGVLRLPGFIDWSYLKDRDLSIRAERLAMYVLVMSEGRPFDMRLWVDPKEFAEVLPELHLPRHLYGPIEEWITDIGLRNAA